MSTAKNYAETKALRSSRRAGLVLEAARKVEMELYKLNQSHRSQESHILLQNALELRRKSERLLRRYRCWRGLRMRCRVNWSATISRAYGPKMAL